MKFKEIKSFQDLFEDYKDGKSFDEWLEWRCERNNFRKYETCNPTDLEHAKECLKHRLFVSYVIFTDPETGEKSDWYEIYNAEPFILYDIEAIRLNTPTKLLRWISHMMEKSWFTKQHLEDLITCYEIINNENFRKYS